ncbi:MAG: peptidase MA family metallohydrolase, partial [Planctomycetota bacterium]
LLLTGVMASPVRAEEPPTAETTRGVVAVRHPPGAKREAEFVLSKMEGILSEVNGALRVPPPPRITVDLLSSAAFENAVGKRKGEWAVAVAFPLKGAILVNLGRIGPRNDLYTTLKHECVHLVLGAAGGRAGKNLPLWFHEGVAQWICGRLFSGTRDEFLVVAKTGKLPPLASLAEAFPEKVQWVHIAYAQSEAFVTHLERERPGTASSILTRVARGMTFDEAFRDALGITLEEAEARWHRELSEGPPFIAVWLTENPGALFFLLFTFGAFASVIAFLRLRKRRRELMRKWEDEEPWEDEP